MKKGIVAAAVLAAGMMGGAGAAPARADCVEVDFEVRYTDRPSWYPLGQPDYCVVPTPWTHTIEYSVERDFFQPPLGLPNGLWLHIWIPVP
jgi:hypothetical protein